MLEQKGTNSTSSKINHELLILITFPILLLFVNNNWIFTDPFSILIDPWVYTGYFLDFSQHLITFQGTYYGSRLAWILPGVVAYKIFPPLIANYVLHLTFFYAALISLYLTLKNTISQRVALFACLLMGSYSYFLYAIGWDYVDGAGITYFLLTILMLTYAAKFPGWKLSLCFSGIFYGGMIYSNIFLITFTPALAIYYLLANHNWRKNSLYPSVSFFAAGIIALTFLLALTNFLTGSNFLFFLPSTYFVLSNVNQSNPWKAFSYSWVKNAGWLILPVIIFLGSILSLSISGIKHFKDKNIFVFLFQLHFILVFLTMVLWELKGAAVLQFQFYASYLIPAMFLAFGSWWAMALVQFSSKQFLLFLSGLMIISLVANALYNPTLLPSRYALSVLPLFVKYSFLISAVLTGLVVFSILIGSKGTKALSFLVPTCIILVILNFTVSDLKNSIYSIYPKSDGFLLVTRSMHTIQNLDKESQSNLRFWYDFGETLGGVFRSVASTYLWGYRLINEKFPDVMDGKTFVSREDIRSIRNIVILSKDEKAYELARKALSKMDLRVNLALSRKINQGEMGFSMTFINIRGGSAYQMDGRRRIKQEDFTVFPVEDRYWSDTADFLVRSVKEGEKLFAPTEFGAKFPGRTYPYSSTGKEDAVFQWAVIHKGRLEEMDKELVKYVAKEFRPVFANEVFIVFSKRNDLQEVDRGSPHYQSFQEKIKFKREVSSKE